MGYYIVAVICPPFAQLCCGRIVAAFFNLLLWLVGILLIPIGVGVLLWLLSSCWACESAWDYLAKQKERDMRRQAQLFASAMSRQAMLQHQANMLAAVEGE